MQADNYNTGSLPPLLSSYISSLEYENQQLRGLIRNEIYHTRPAQSAYMPQRVPLLPEPAPVPHQPLMPPHPVQETQPSYIKPYVPPTNKFT